MGYEYGYGMGHSVFHGLFSVLVIVLVIMAVVWLFRALTGRGKGHPRCRRKSEALSLLESRYVNGEIEREEFQAKRDDLLGSASPG